MGSGLSLNLSSNNPFRNRAVSPTNLPPRSPASPFDDPVPPPRPTSRNPFLDPANKPVQSQSEQLLILTDDMDSKKTDNRSPTAEEIFVCHTLVAIVSQLCSAVAPTSRKQAGRRHPRKPEFRSTDKRPPLPFFRLTGRPDTR